jgi:hypothetical protein
MLRHIVMWRLKDEYEGMDKNGIAHRMKERLEALQETVPQLGELEVGIDINGSENAADVVLYSSFADKDALDAYQKHPSHQEVVAFVKEVVTERRVVDYEV